MLTVLRFGFSALLAGLDGLGVFCVRGIRDESAHGIYRCVELFQPLFDPLFFNKKCIEGILVRPLGGVSFPRHVFHFASARARRQGPAVLELRGKRQKPNLQPETA